MSRSYRKVPIFGIAADSDKDDKRHANRRLRRMTRECLRLRVFETLPLLREVSSVWGFSKDGKIYWPSATKKDMYK